LGGTVTLQDSITVNGAITLYAGILDFNNMNPTFASFDSSVNYNARTLNLGNGTITVNSTASITKWNVDSTNFTLIRGTSTIVMTSAGTNAQSMTGSGLVYNNLTIGGLGVYTFNFYNSNTYSTLEIDRSESAKTIGGSGTETVSQLSIPVVSTTVVTINGISFAQALGIFATEYVNVTSSTVTGISYYAGATPPSVDGGGNTGWIFSEPPLPVVTTLGASQVQFYSAIFNGALDTLAGQPNGYVCFEYGTTSSYGSETPQQFVTTAGTFYQAMTGMTAGTTYHFKARFYYNSGAAYVDGLVDQSFSTFGSSGIPSITTLDATNLSVTTMTLQGRIDNTGGIATVYAYIEWGLDKNYLGGTTPQLSYTSPSSILQGQITELSRSTTYHFQAVLKYYDSAGVLQTVLGGDKTAKTLFVSGASEVITIISANAFRGYEEDGDYLFTAEVMDTYRTDTEKLYPTANIGKYFFLQLLDPTDTTILAQTPLAFWGDRPISIYLNAVAGAGLTEGAYYHLKVVGNFVGAPTASSQDYTLTDDDWGGTSLILLDDWCISAAQNMEISDNVAPGSYVVSSTDNKQVITNAAGGYFTTGIPQISAIRPNLFQQSESQATATLGAKNDQWSSKHVWATQVGAQIASDWNTIGSLFYGDSAHGASAMGFILLIIAILICIFGVMLGGKGLPLLILSFPLLYWGTEMGALAYQWLLVPCVAMVMLWARQFWVKPT
jgi:hypothetical protein